MEKQIRGAKVNGKSPTHMVSAWTSMNNIVLGQVKVEEKSNEITAIPNLIESTREFKGKDKTEKSCRYYISSLDRTAEEF